MDRTYHGTDVTIVVKRWDDGGFSAGFAFVGHADQFCRKRGRTIAMGRASYTRKPIKHQIFGINKEDIIERIDQYLLLQNRETWIVETIRKSLDKIRD